MEHRYGRRYPVRQPVYFQTPDEIIGAGWLTEVSISGGSVITHRPMNVDDCVQVRLLTAPGARLRHHGAIAAQVVRPTQYGWALEWEELMPELLEQLVAKPAQIASEDLVERTCLWR